MYAERDNHDHGANRLPSHQAGHETLPRRNPADNLTREARIRGGMHSARNQRRDAFGQFAGRRSTSGDGAAEPRGRRMQARSTETQPGGGSPDGSSAEQR